MRKLNVWLIAEGETMPQLGDLIPDMKNARMMRMGIISKHLSEKGHYVTWWNSSFDHYTKTYYCNEYREFQISPNEKLILLHSPTSYKKNITPMRLLYNRNLAQDFLKHSSDKEKPDIIFCALPLPAVAAAAIKYGQKHNVPVVIDVLDLWPDLYYRAVPKFLQPLAKIAIHFMRKSIGRSLRNAAGFTGVSPIAVEWGCRTAGRKPGRHDRPVFISNEVQELSAEDMAENLKWWAEQGITRDTWNICFFGSLSIHSGVDTAIKAVKQLADIHKDIRLVIGGAGDMKETFIKLADGCPNIIFPGFLNQKQMNSLMSIAKCGVYCFNLKDFDYMFGNKIAQYLSCDLPVLNSLTGFSRTLIEEEHCGLNYQEGDPDDCAAKILQLYNNESERRKMSENAHSLFMSKIETKKVTQQFENYFYEIVNTFGKE